jgi:hypothetical protein
MRKSAIRSVAMAGALVASALPAFAFQESTVGSGADKPAASAKGAPGLDLSLPDVGSKQSQGTEIRIPGVGTVGVLPKLDFGLEMLYGSGTEPMGRPDERSQPDGVQLRGSIKYRF